MGITTLEELEKAIPKDFVERNIQFHSFASYGSSLINIMIIRDSKTYFEKAWSQSWNTVFSQEVDLLKYYGVPIDDYIKELGLEVIDLREFDEPSEDISEEIEWEESLRDEEPPEPEPDESQINR